MKTVVLGGYGNFGARICRALATRAQIELVVAGRDLAKAQALAGALGGRAVALRIDTNDPDLARQLQACGAELVIHTAGPFQQQGYAVPRAVAAAGAHYIDLADGRRFVCDFVHELDSAFRAQNKTAISGASTVPALSSAVVNALTCGWQAIHTIDYCIAPAQNAPRGIATIRAVLDYCGAPIAVWIDGRFQSRYGWIKPQRVDFLRMPARRGSLCDIPDLELFPQHYPGVQTVTFRAALEIGAAQWTLAAIALLRRFGVVRHPERLAATFNRLADMFDPLGTSRSAMVVRVTGRDQHGQACKRAWHITADDDHGPEIPCMASILLADRLARAAIDRPGAHTSIGWLTLEEFASEFAKWNMVTDLVDEPL